MEATVQVTSATPYICVRGAEDALAFYRKAFGAEIIGQPMMYQGRVGHAEFRVGSCDIYIADESPESGVQSPLTLGNCTCIIVLSVSDVDAFVERARAAGAQIAQEPTDQPYGRTGKILDPFGQRWIITAAKN